ITAYAKQRQYFAAINKSEQVLSFSMILSKKFVRVPSSPLLKWLRFPRSSAYRRSSLQSFFLAGMNVPAKPFDLSLYKKAKLPPLPLFLYQTFLLFPVFIP
ncbi:MAG: hypothetical protein ACLUFF_05105, partial [Acutalibacteraceae bacterium]